MPNQIDAVIIDIDFAAQRESYAGFEWYTRKAIIEAEGVKQEYTFTAKTADEIIKHKVGDTFLLWC